MVSKCSIYLILAAGFLLNSAHADVSTIEGSAHFVLHHTIVPLAIVPLENFPHSQPYWTLNVTSEGTDYEVGQQFNLGDESQPDSIDIGGVTIPAGSVISLEGQISYSADHYAYLQNVDHVMLVRKDYQVILPTREPIEDAFSDWNCAGVSAAQAEIFAHIWYQADSENLKGYYVVDLSGENFRNASHSSVQIASVEKTQAKQKKGSILFQGENDEAKVSISIQTSEENAQVPGLIKFEVKNETSERSSLKMDSVRVNCTRSH